MNQDDRLDLSPLDPMRDPARWRAVVDSTLNRVDAVLLQRAAQDPLTLIAQWTRPLLVATAATIAMLVPVELALEARERQTEQVERLVALSSALDERSEPPSSADFLRALAEQGAP